MRFSFYEMYEYICSISNNLTYSYYYDVIVRDVARAFAYFIAQLTTT